jgi:hypothetical protein
MMTMVVDRLVHVLATFPEPVLPSSAMGTRRPSNGSQVPAVVISLAIDSAKGHGIGRFVRSGNAVVRSSAVIEVQPTPQTFSSDLRTLRIWPLPLKKDPSSVERTFSENDLQITNLTDAAHPIVYRMTDAPAQRDEYRLDVPQALVRFGQAQTLGERLELVHWTVAWRDEIPVYRYHGTATLETWANSDEQVDELGRKLQVRLGSEPELLQQEGFLALAPVRLEPAEHVIHDPPVGSPFAVWRQRAAYRFSFEGEEPVEVSSGVPIKRIDVAVPDGAVRDGDVDAHVQELFSVPYSQ